MLGRVTSMIKNRVVAGCVAIALACSTTMAFAAPVVAELIAINGKVLVNQGNGFVAAGPDVSLAVGDQIMVGADATAEIKYANGCNVTVNASAVVRIAAQAPCKKGEPVAMVDSVLVTPAFGNGQGASELLVLLPVIAVVAAVGVLASMYDEPTAIPVTLP